MNFRKNVWLNLHIAMFLCLNQVLFVNPLRAEPAETIAWDPAANGPTVSYQDSAENETSETQPPGLYADNPLSLPTISLPDQSVSEWESFDANEPLLAQAAEDGLPVAFLVSDLDAEKLKSLVDGEKPEVLILAFRSEGQVQYLFYSSGSKEDIRSNPLVHEMIDSLQAQGEVLVAHSHVDHYYQGPSPFDQEASSGAEALLTSNGAYLYGTGAATPERMDYDGLMSWLQNVQSDLDEKIVLDKIHDLIAAVDALRTQLEQAPEMADSVLQPLRQGDLTTDERITTPDSFTSPSVIAADTVAKIETDPSYSDQFDVSIMSPARLRVSYSDLTGENESAGLTLYNSDDAAIGLQSLTELVFRLSSSEEASDLRVEIVQQGTGTSDLFDLAGIGTDETTYVLDLTELDFDASTIGSIRFVRDPSMTPSGQGYFDVVLPSSDGYGMDAGLGDASKAAGDVTRLPMGATVSATAAGGGESELSDQSDTQNTITYSGLDIAGGSAGMTWEYVSTGKDFSKRTFIVLGLKGTAEGARLEIEDIDGRKGSIDLTGIGSDEFRYYTIDLDDPAFAGQGVDFGKILRVNVMTDLELAGNASGTLDVQLGEITSNTPLTGTIARVSQPAYGTLENKTYSVDPTRLDLQEQLLTHTLQENLGNLTYQITTLEVLPDGTDTGKWLSIQEQTQLAADTYEIKSYEVVGDTPGDQTKGDLLYWVIQKRNADGSFETTEVSSDTANNQIIEQKELSAAQIAIWTYDADFTDMENGLTQGSTSASSVTSDDLLSAALHYDGLDADDTNLYAGATWKYSTTASPTGVNLTGSALNFSLKGTAALAWLGIQDANGQEWWTTIQGISAVDFMPYSVSMDDASISDTIDITKIRRIDILVDGSGAGNSSGTLEIQWDSIPGRNSDGVKGDLQSYVVQEDLGGGTFRMTGYKIEDGAATDEIVSITDQTQLAEGTFDIKTYEPVIVPAAVQSSENFEDAFPPEEYTVSGDAGWAQDAVTFHDGAAAAVSGVVTDGERSVMQTVYEALSDGVLSFSWKVSSESNFDYLYFCVDSDSCTRDQALSSISGAQDWAQYSADLSAGSHTLTWVYEKDGSVSVGSDRGWVDGLQFTSNETVAPLLQTHAVQEDLGDGKYRITSFKVEDGVAADEVISIVDQEELAAGIFEISTYQVNEDGSKGELQGHVIQRDFGGGVFRIITFRVEDGVSTDEVVSIVDQTELDAATFDIQTYQVVTEPGTVLGSQDFEGAFPPENFTTSGDAGWTQDDATFHDGTAAAASGIVDDSGRSVLQYTYDAAADGTLSFSWKVSSEMNFDFLYFCVDTESCTIDQSLASISGEEDWAEMTANLNAGSHTLTWVYEKDDSAGAGSDMGWIDGIQFTSNETLTSVLQSHVVQEDLGDGLYRITSYKVEDGVATDEVISIVDQTDLGANTFDIKTYLVEVVPAAVQAAQAFEEDFPPADYEVSGDADWTQDTVTFHDGTAAAASGVVTDGERSVMQTTFDAAADGVLSFFWKVSSETDFDYLYFCVDSDTCTKEQALSAISGDTDWTEYSADLSAGSHNLTWVYEKDDSVSAGNDMGWIDGIQFATSQAINPVLQSHVLQEELEEGGFRVTTFAVDDGVATNEILSTVDQADAAVPAPRNTALYEPVTDAASIRESQNSDEALSLSPMETFTQAGSFTDEESDTRVDPDGNSPVSSESTDSTEPPSDDFPLGDSLTRGGGGGGDTGNSGAPSYSSLSGGSGGSNYLPGASAGDGGGGAFFGFSGRYPGQTDISQSDFQESNSIDHVGVQVVSDRVLNDDRLFLKSLSAYVKFSPRSSNNGQPVAKSLDQKVADAAKREGTKAVVRSMAEEDDLFLSSLSPYVKFSHRKKILKNKLDDAEVQETAPEQIENSDDIAVQKALRKARRRSMLSFTKNLFKKVFRKEVRLDDKKARPADSRLVLPSVN